MGIRFESKAVLAKIETTVGTDSVPTGAANAVLLKGVEINALNGEAVPREIIRAGYGAMAGWFVGRHVTITARVDLAGAGTAGTVPGYGPLLRACGLAETVTPGTKVDYTPVHSSFESVSIYYNHAGTRHIATGVRGSAKLKFTKRKTPEIEFTLIGLWQSDTSVAMPALTLTAWKDPLPSTKANTTAYTIDGQAVLGSTFELDAGMDCAYRDLLNSEEIIVRDRLPKLTALIEELPLATKNFFAMVGGAAVPITYTHGVGAGKIIDISVPLAQLQPIARQEEDTISMLNIPAIVTLGGPSEFTISVK